MIDSTTGAQPVQNDASASNTPPQPQPAATPAPDAQQPNAASPTTSAPAQLQPQSSTSSTPLSQYSHVSSDGRYGWDAQQKQWQPIGAVANTPAPVPPGVHRAGVLRQIAETLAGGPRYQTTIDPQTGATTRTPLPMSKTSIGLAIALEALSGGLTGLAAKGPNATGQAAAMGFQQGQELAQQRQQQDQQAQQDARNQSQALAAKAAAFESNSRAILNTAQAERYGVDSLKDSVSINAPLLDSYKDAGAVQESNVSQDDLSAGVASGKYDPTKVIGIPDGFTNINGRYEQTFSIVSNPSAKVPLSQAQAKAFADAGIPGWTAFKTSNVPQGFEVRGTQLAIANAQLQAINLMKQDVSHVTDALSKSGDKATQELAKTVPDFNALLQDKSNGPVLRSALMRFQKYVSHSDISHGMDFYQSLQQMVAQSKPDPRNPKQMIPNPDTGAAQTIAGAFGNGDPQRGWAILKTYSQLVTPSPIKDAAEAESIATDPTSSPRQVARAKAFLATDEAHKAAVARAGAEARASVKSAGGTGTGNGSGALGVSSLTPKEYSAIVDGIGTNTLDASQMLRYGKADQLKILADVKAKYPNFDTTQYQANLSLAKWATSGKGGDQIQALNTLHAHAKDFSDNANQLGNLDASFLNTPINKLKNMTGNPNVTATVARMLAVRTEYMNVLNNQHALSVEDKADAQKLLNENQSPAQWQAAIDQITHTADLRGAETNARYKATFGKDMPNYRGSQSQAGATNIVPPGATPGRDASGRVIGYRTADGKVIRF